MRSGPFAAALFALVASILPVTSQEYFRLTLPAPLLGVQAGDTGTGGGTPSAPDRLRLSSQPSDVAALSGVPVVRDALQVTGGEGPLEFSLSGYPTNLGIVLDPDSGVLSVSSSVPSGDYGPFRISVTDPATSEWVQSDPFVVRVRDNLAFAQQPSEFSTIAGTAATRPAPETTGGFGPLKYTVTGESGHPGVSADAEGALTVSATVPAGVYGPYSYVVDDLGSDGEATSNPFQIRVYAPLQSSGHQSMAGRAGTAFSSPAPTTTGGSGKYRYTMTGSPTHSGIGVNQNTGVVSVGANVPVSNYGPFTVTAQDVANGAVASSGQTVTGQPFTITVSARPAMQMTLPNGTTMVFQDWTRIPEGVVNVRQHTNNYIYMAISCPGGGTMTLGNYGGTVWQATSWSGSCLPGGINVSQAWMDITGTETPLPSTISNIHYYGTSSQKTYTPAQVTWKKIN